MRKAGDILTSLFRERFGSEFVETARSNAALFSSWENVVCEVWPPGFDQKKEDIPAAAVHSRIRELERGMLLVEADHPGWVQILQTKQAELLKAFQRHFPKLEISGIAFTLSRGPVFSPEKPRVNLPAINSTKEKASVEGKTVISNTEVETKRKTSGGWDEDFYTALKNLEESVKKRNA